VFDGEIVDPHNIELLLLLLLLVLLLLVLLSVDKEVLAVLLLLLFIELLIDAVAAKAKIPSLPARDEIAIASTITIDSASHPRLLGKTLLYLKSITVIP
jgi:hypothetical protein